MIDLTDQLTVVIEYDLVEHAPRRLPALVLVYHAGAQLLQRERVRDGFRGRLRSGLSPSCHLPFHTVPPRAVMIPGLESAPEYDQSIILTLFRGDFGSGSFQMDPLESAPVLESAPLVVLTPLLEPFIPSRAYYFLF